MTDRDLQENVQKALDWEPSVDAAEIGVSVDNGVVTLRGDVKTLTGNVHSWFERDEARHAAWAAPGVEEVDDRIAVTP